MKKSLNPLTRQLLADKLATLHQLALSDGQIVKTGALLIVPRHESSHHKRWTGGDRPF